MGKHACNGTGVPFLYYVRTIEYVQQKQLMNAAAGFRFQRQGKQVGAGVAEPSPFRSVPSCHGYGEGQLAKSVPSISLPARCTRVHNAVGPARISATCATQCRPLLDAHALRMGVPRDRKAMWRAPHDHRLSALMHACCLLLVHRQNFNCVCTVPHRTAQKKTSREESANSNQIGYTDPVRKAQKRGVPWI